MEINFVFKAWHYWLLVIILFLNTVITSRIDDNIKKIMDKVTNKNPEDGEAK